MTLICFMASVFLLSASTDPEIYYNKSFGWAFGLCFAGTTFWTLEFLGLSPEMVIFLRFMIFTLLALIVDDLTDTGSGLFTGLALILFLGTLMSLPSVF